MSVVDDFGRYYATPQLVRAACYPLKLEKVSDSDIGKWLTECVNAALVRVYPASDGKRYLEVLKFGEPRAKRSRFPDAVVAPTPDSGTVDQGDVGTQMQTDVNKCTQTQASVPYSPFAFRLSNSPYECERGTAPPNGDASHSSEPKNGKHRATRLAADWKLPDAWKAWAMEAHGLDAQKVVRLSLDFRDYWVAVAGSKGVKLDWGATWRRWVRKECGGA
jgi:hypothetical protein